MQSLHKTQHALGIQGLHLTLSVAHLSFLSFVPKLKAFHPRGHILLARDVGADAKLAHRLATAAPTQSTAYNTSSGDLLTPAKSSSQNAFQMLNRLQSVCLEETVNGF